MLTNDFGENDDENNERDDDNEKNHTYIRRLIVKYLYSNTSQIQSYIKSVKIQYIPHITSVYKNQHSISHIHISKKHNDIYTN